MWPIADHGFSTKVGDCKFCSRCDICFRWEQLSKFGDIKQEEGKELGDSIEGTLGRGQWVGDLNGLLADGVFFIWVNGLHTIRRLQHRDEPGSRIGDSVGVLLNEWRSYTGKQSTSIFHGSHVLSPSRESACLPVLADVAFTWTQESLSIQGWRHGFWDSSCRVDGGFCVCESTRNVKGSWAGRLPPCSCGFCIMHMSRGCLPEVGAGTQSYFSLSEWEYIYCAIICWKSLICFLIFTRCDSLRDCLECQKGHWTFALFRLLQIVRIIEVRLNAFSFFFFIFFCILIFYKTSWLLCPLLALLSVPQHQIYLRQDPLLPFSFRKEQVFQGYQPNTSFQGAVTPGTSSYIKAVEGNTIGGKMYQKEALESQTIWLLQLGQPQTP